MSLRIDVDSLFCLLMSLASLIGTAWFFDPQLWHLW
jgi:hypothetical protein